MSDRNCKLIFKVCFVVGGWSQTQIKRINSLNPFRPKLWTFKHGKDCVFLTDWRTHHREGWLDRKWWNDCGIAFYDLLTVTKLVKVTVIMQGGMNFDRDHLVQNLCEVSWKIPIPIALVIIWIDHEFIHQTLWFIFKHSPHPSRLTWQSMVKHIEKYITIFLDVYQ